MSINDTNSKESFDAIGNWVNGGVAATFAPAGNSTYEVTGGNATGAGSLLRAYGPAFSGTASNTWAGGNLTIDSGGILLTKTTGTITIGDLILNGGELDDGSGGPVAGNITLAFGTTSDISAQASATVSSVITGSGNLTIGGNSSNQGNDSQTGNNSFPVTLSGSNSFTGLTTISANGTLNLNNTNAIQDSTLVYSVGKLVFNSGVGGNFTFGGLSGSSNIALNDGTHAVALTVGTNNTDTSYSGALSGNGSLTKVGTGNLTLGNNDTYTGNTTINNGAIQLGADQRSRQQHGCRIGRRYSVLFLRHHKFHHRRPQWQRQCHAG